MRFILTIALALTGSFASAQINGTDGKASTLFTNNFVKNPSAATNNFYVVTNSATATRDTNASNKVDGKASWLIDTSANGGFAQWDFLPESSEVTSGGNCAFRGIFKGDASLYAAKVTDGLGNLVYQVPLTNESGWREFIVPVTCATTGGNRRVRIEQIVAGTSPAINVGKVSWGRYEAQYIQPPNTFTAQIDPSGVITRQTPYNWLASCSGTSSKTCLFVSNFVANPMNCTATQSVGGSSGGKTLYAIQSNSNQVSFALAENNAAANLGASISCTKTGTDYAQPALTVQDMDYDDKSYTPGVAGLGTVTNSQCFEKRVGSDNLIRCKLTVSGGTASEMRVNLNGLTSAGTGIIPTITKCGEGFANVPGNTTWFSQIQVLCEPSVGYVTFGINQSTSNPINKINGSAITASAFTFTFNARVPIQGWGAVTAPPIAGLVGTGNKNSFIHTESVFVGGPGGYASNCTSSPCTLKNSTIQGASVTLGATGVYTASFPTSLWRAPDSYSCSAEIINWASGANPACIPQAGTQTATSLVLNCQNNTGNVNASFRLNCYEVN